MTDNRLECGGDGFGCLITENPTANCGDFISPEQIIPPLEDGLRTPQGDTVPWESCMTSNNNWGYVQFDHEYKYGPTIIKKLVECVSKGGNMLLNLGLTARGELPRSSVEALEQVGRWMHDNGKAIYGCAASGLLRPEFGRYTRQGNYIYAHVMEPSVGPVCLRGIRPEQVKKARLVSNGAELLLAESWATKLYPDCAFVSLGPDPLASYALPDPIDTVIEIELK